MAGSPPLESLRGMAGRPKQGHCQCYESCLQSPPGAPMQNRQTTMASLKSICCQHFLGHQLLARETSHSRRLAFTSLKLTGKGSAMSARSAKSIDLIFAFELCLFFPPSKRPPLTPECSMQREQEKLEDCSFGNMFELAGENIEQVREQEEHLVRSAILSTRGPLTGDHAQTFIRFQAYLKDLVGWAKQWQHRTFQTQQAGLHARFCTRAAQHL